MLPPLDCVAALHMLPHTHFCSPMQAHPQRDPESLRTGLRQDTAASASAQLSCCKHMLVYVKQAVTDRQTGKVVHRVQAGEQGG